jgi:hypothetical protein
MGLLLEYFLLNAICSGQSKSVWGQGRVKLHVEPSLCMEFA